MHFKAVVFILPLMPSHVQTHNLTDSLSENFLCLSTNMITNVSLLPVTCPVEFMWPKTTQRFMVHAKLMGHQHLPSICPIIATMDISSTVTGKFYFFPFLLSTSWNFSHFCDEFAPITTGNIPSVDILWFYEVTKLEDSSSVIFFFFLDYRHILFSCEKELLKVVRYPRAVLQLKPKSLKGDSQYLRNLILGLTEVVKYFLGSNFTFWSSAMLVILHSEEGRDYLSAVISNTDNAI